MSPSTAPLQSASLPNSLATDTRSLDRLKERAIADPQAAVKEAARQFEALFMQAVVKSMRDAIPKSELHSSSGGEMYTQMYDQQIAMTLAGRPGGLSDAINRQLAGGLLSASAPKAGSASGAAAGTATGIGTGGTTGSTPGAAKGTAKGASAVAPFAVPGQTPLTPPVAGLTAEQAQFVQRLWQPAVAAQRDTGVPAAFIIGQAALETGWGKHEIRRPDGSSAFNLFGIKAGGNWRGESVAALTTEFVDGRPRKMTEGFRAYTSHEESMRDWARLISQSPRYSAVVRDGQTVEGFAQGLQKAGYATDPDYAAKLTRVINSTLSLKRAGNAADISHRAGLAG